MKEKSQIAIFWITALVGASALTAYELSTASYPLKASLNFFSGVLTFDGVLLALLALKPEASAIGRLSQRYKVLDQDLLGLILVVSAGSAAFALLHISNEGIVRIGLMPGTGVIAATCFFTTSLALLALGLSSLYAILGNYLTRKIAEFRFPS